MEIVIINIIILDTCFYVLPGLKNRINGTQRTEQSEVYGTKKEEKREKRRKLV